MPELAIDIVARARQVAQQLNKTVKQIDQLEKQFNQASQAATNFTNRSILAGKGVLELNKGVVRLNRGMGNTSSIAFQAGQAVSDFAVAGIRGAANNLEFLALQLGASGPVIAGITAVTVSLLLFAEDIKKGFLPIQEEIDKTKKALDDFLKVTDNIFTDAEYDKNTLNLALVEVEETIKRIESTIKSERSFFTAVLTGITGFNIRIPFTDLTDAEESLGRQKGLLEKIEERLEGINEKEEAAATIAENKNLDIVRSEQQLKKAEEERLAREAKIKHELEEQAKELERQRKELEKIQAAAEALARSRRETAIRPVSPGPDVSLGTGSGGFATDESLAFQGLKPLLIETEEVSGRVSKVANQLGIDLSGLNEDLLGLGTGVKGMSDEAFAAFEGIVSGADRSAEAFDRAGISARDFYTQTTVGLQSLANATETLTGGMADMFEGLFEASGEKTKAFFALSKAFSIAQAVINTYEAASKALTAGPIVGPILAAGIIATGLGYVAKIAATQPGSSSGGGVSSASSGASGPGLVDPRQGRTGRFQRSIPEADPSVSIFPLAPDINSSLSQVLFRIQGDDLVGVNERVSRRQSRTRG